MQVEISVTLINLETAAEDFVRSLEDLIANINEFGLDDTDLVSITGHVEGKMTVEDL